MKRKIIASLLILTGILFIAVYYLTRMDRAIRPRNVIFILIDTLRADHLSAYGYHRKTSPNIDELASKGILFERCFSQAGFTPASVSSFFTSMYPDFHKVATFEQRLSDRLIKISDVMRSAGYFTAGGSTNVGVSDRSGYADGFDFWSEGLDDIRLTRWAETFIDRDDISYYHIKKYNLIKDSSFQETTTFGAVKGFGTVIPGILGYFDDTCLRLRMRYLLNDRPVTLTGGLKVDKKGLYGWGMAVRVEKMSEPVRLELIAVDGKENIEVLDRKEIKPASEWKFYRFKCKIKSAFNDVRIRISSPLDWVQYPDNSFKQIFVDELFLLPLQEPLKTKPLYLYLHYMSPHSPHLLPPEAGGKFDNIFSGQVVPEKRISSDRGDPFGLNDHKFILQAKNAREWIRQSDSINWHINHYDEEILFSDSEVKRLVNVLKKTGEYNSTLLIITADHGEEFLEHGFISHSQSLYNELLHIPLIMVCPELWDGGVRVKAMVESIDLLPTLAEIVNVNPSLEGKLKNQMMGMSLIPALEGKNFAGKKISYASDYLSKQFSIISENKKYIRKKTNCSFKELLFDIERDFPEKKDLSAGHRDLVQRFRLITDEYCRRAEKLTDIPVGSSTFDAAQMQLIRGLGYITRNDVVMRGLDTDCFLVWLRFAVSASLSPF